MTIALGVLTPDAVVVGADTEQTWGYLKTSGTKVFAKEANGAIAVTGSGTSSYLESLSQELQGVFVGNPKARVDSLAAKFKETLELFFQKHVFPAAGIPDPPSCDVIIAMERHGQRRLWASTNDVLRSCDPIALVGIGAEFADNLLKRVLDGKTIDLKKVRQPFAERLVAYAVFLAKESVRHVGMGTDVVSIIRGKATPIDPGVLEILEYHFNGHTNLQALGLQYVLGYPFSDDMKSLETLKRYFKSLQVSVARTKGIQTSSQPWTLE